MEAVYCENRVTNTTLNRTNTIGLSKISGKDQTALLALAQSDPNEYGMVVHVAAALLDTIFYKDYVLEEDIDFETGKLAASGINLFPNPVEDQLTVVSVDSDIEYISVYNLSGNCILTASLSAGTNIIDLAALPAGVYLVKVHPDNGADSSQLIYKN